MIVSGTCSIFWFSYLLLKLIVDEKIIENSLWSSCRLWGFHKITRKIMFEVRSWKVFLQMFPCIWLRYTRKWWSCHNKEKHLALHSSRWWTNCTTAAFPMDDWGYPPWLRTAPRWTQDAVEIYGYLSGWWFLATPLKNMSSSIGMISNPICGKIKHVPNHQPAMDSRKLRILCWSPFESPFFWHSHGSAMLVLPWETTPHGCMWWKIVMSDVYWKCSC